MNADPTVASARERDVLVLHVDDDPSFAELTATFLETEEPRLSVVTVGDADAALDRLEAGDVDCVVSDYDMPGRNGIELLETVRERDPDLPFVLFTGKGSEEVASDAVSAGVTDYLQKEPGTDQYTVLANRIVNVTEKRRTEADLERRTSQHEAVAALGRRALETTDLGGLFDEAVALLTDRLGHEYAKVLELESADELRIVAGKGWDDGLVGSATVSTGADSQAGYTLESTEPVVVTDLETETRFSGPDLLVDHGVRGGISVVVGSHDDPWGVLGTHTTRRRQFIDHDVTFVQNVANVLAAAIDRRRTEERLRESETRFREIAELSPDGIFRTDTSGVFTYVSPAGEELLGRPAAELVGTRFDRLVAEGSIEAAVEGVARVVDGDVVRGLELTLRDGDGEPFDVEVSASPVRRDGEVALVQGFARDVTERNERERELRRARERFQALVDNFPNGGVFLFDHDLQYTVAGGDELEQVGLTPERMLGRTPSRVFPPENAAVLESHYRAALDGERRSFEDSWQGRRYHIQTIPLRNDAGEVIAGMAVAQNVTERARQAQALQESQERYQTLVDNFPGGVFLFDHELRIEATGGTELERAGMDPEEIKGRTIHEVLPAEGVRPLEPHYRATLDGEARSFEYEWADEQYHVQTVPLRDADDRVVSGMAVARNVTDRNERERKLDLLRQRSQSLMHTTTKAETARVAVDATNEVIGAPLSSFHAPNEAGDVLEPLVMTDAAYGVFDEEPTYRRDAEPGSRAAAMWEVFERGESLYVDDVGAYEPLNEPTPIESVSVHPVGDHGLFIVAATESTVFDETDEALVDILVASLTTAMDRVEREQRLLGRERRLEQQNERLSKFASIVSHDLRNPLSVASGRLALLRTESPHVDEHLDAMETAHRRMEELIEDLLTLALHGETEDDDERVDLATVAETSWENVETQGARLVVDTDGTLRANRGRLQQLLENLFRNSVEHGSTGPRSQAREDSVEHGSTGSQTAEQSDDSLEHGSTGERLAPNGGTEGHGVTVTIGSLEPDTSGRTNGETGMRGSGGFYVADDGPGIPEAERGEVFEAGYSTSEDGTGFGLNIVAEVAQSHGWEIRVAESTDGGARFEFSGVDVD